MQLLLLAAALLTGAAAAGCAACAPVQVVQAPSHSITLDGGLANCTCTVVVVYSRGSRGVAYIDKSPGAAVAVYGAFDGDREVSSLLARFGPANALSAAEVVSGSGILAVVVEAGSSAEAADAQVAVYATAVNQAPVVSVAEGLVLLGVGGGVFLDGVSLPFGTHPTPLQVWDPDNGDRGLRVELAMSAGVGTAPLVNLLVPAVPTVVFEVGQPDTPLRRVVVSGPGLAVEAAVNNTRIAPFGITVGAVGDNYVVTASDLGHAGEGNGELVSEYGLSLGFYASGDIVVPRGRNELLSSGVLREDATYFVEEASELRFTTFVFRGPVGECPETFVRVYDGPTIDNGRLISTDYTPTGELCGPIGVFPRYTSTTGSFVIEVVYRPPVDGVSAPLFRATVDPTPLGFVVWTLEPVGDALHVASDSAAVLLPQLLVTLAPDPSNITVVASASSGSVGLRFADSFADLIMSTSGGALVLRSTRHVRLGDALREVVYTPPHTSFAGEDAVVVRAWSGGQEAEQLTVPILVSTTALNVPPLLTTTAFRPLAVPVAVAGDAGVAVTVTATGGIGQVSADPRALEWIEVGFGVNATLSGSGTITYKAAFGGTDELVVRMGAIERIVVVEVDPDCDGDYFIYGRNGTITERAGPPAEEHQGSPSCSWTVIGARTLTFVHYDIDLPQIFLVLDGIGRTLYVQSFIGEPTRFVSTENTAHFTINYEADLYISGTSSTGFVALAGPVPGINDPPLVVVPTQAYKIVRGTATRLTGLYINDFAPGPIHAALEVDVGALRLARDDGEESKLLEVDAASFDELDAWATGIDFVAGDAQTTATAVLQARDAFGAAAAASFAIDVLPCRDTIDVAIAPDGAASIVDGSGVVDYTGGLACSWRLTGAAAPAQLVVEFLDLDCRGDTVDVLDGSNVAGREIASSLCQAPDRALVSSSGSFFVVLATNSDGHEADGFSFVYRSVRPDFSVDLGPAPLDHDPVRSGAMLAALGASGVVVHGGHSGVRPVSSTLVFQLSGWAPLALAGQGRPPGRTNCAGAVLEQSQLVVHGGVDALGTVVAETWTGDLDLAASTVTWSRLDTTGPATATGGMFGRYLVDTSGVWVLDRVAWMHIGSAPPGVLGSTVAGELDGSRWSPSTVAGGFALDLDGSLWSLSIDLDQTVSWALLDVTLGAPGPAVRGAMLGADEYMVAGVRINTTSLAVDMLVVDGDPVGGVEYEGHPAVFLYGDGRMQAVALTLSVDEYAPLVAPSRGGTVLTLAGEQLSTCDEPACVFGDAAVPVVLLSERRAQCTVPRLDSGSAPVRVVCGGHATYTAGEAPVEIFDEPQIGKVEPQTPRPGETIAVEVLGVADRVLAAAGETALCRLDGSMTVAATVDAPLLRCTLPADGLGRAVSLEISLDGQQFASETATVSVSVSSQKPLFDQSRATIVGLVLAGGLGIGAVPLFRWAPPRAPRAVILAVPLGVVDVYFDVVFASKLRDESSPLAEWSAGVLVTLLVLNLTIVLGFLYVKLRLSSGRHAFVKWLGKDGSVMALAIAGMLGLLRVKALALLMTRMGGWARFDAAGLSDQDWHRLAAADVVSALVEDVGQFAVQMAYLSGDDAQVDTATVVTVGLSVAMIVFALFQGLGRGVVVASRGRVGHRNQERELE